MNAIVNIVTVSAITILLLTFVLFNFVAGSITKPIIAVTKKIQCSKIYRWKR
jgi:methyl-accepting chemotaxis protein